MCSSNENHRSISFTSHSPLTLQPFSPMHITSHLRCPSTSLRLALLTSASHFSVCIVNESKSRFLDWSMDPESNQNHIYMKRSKLLLKCHRFCDCIAFPFYRFIYDYVSAYSSSDKNTNNNSSSIRSSKGRQASITIINWRWRCVAHKNERCWHAERW